MKKFLKLAILPISLLITSQLTSCNLNPKEVALIVDVGDIDDGSFNQASWEAVKEYCTEHNKTYNYYRPFTDSDFARMCSVKQAVSKGAKFIVFPGFKFQNCASQVQSLYPDVNFLLIDSATNDLVRVNSNLCCVSYACEISGYLAGCAVSYDYLTYDWMNDKKLKDVYDYGYCGGMASDGVLQFGLGFIQGLLNMTSYFCKNNCDNSEITIPKVRVRYNYAGVFAQDDAAASLIKSWFAGGCKCVFPCGGKLYQSITEGVKDYNRKNNYYDFDENDPPRECARWVGVDSDQYQGLSDDHEKKTIYTSALKGLGETIKTSLDYHFKGEFADMIGGAYDSSDKEIFDSEGKSLGFDDATKQWPLGLHTKFGGSRPNSKGKNDDVPEKNYVGLPEVYKEDGKTFRGFKYFNKDNYDKLIENILGDTVYGKNGTELYDDTGKAIGKDYMGNPLIFKKGDSLYLDDGRHDAFKDCYYKDFPINQIDIIYT